MTSITVLVNGATGKMGTETVAAVSQQEDLVLVGATCRNDRGPALALPNGKQVPLSTNLEELIHRVRPDVLVDFTNATACMEAASVAQVAVHLLHRTALGGIGLACPESQSPGS